jgi:hypothetical protein
LIYWIPVLPEGNASPTHLYAKTAAQKALAACADAWKIGFVRLKSVRHKFDRDTRQRHGVSRGPAAQHQR